MSDGPFAIPDFISFCIIIILFTMILMEILDWGSIKISFDKPPPSEIMDEPSYAFLYGDDNGPKFWRCAYPEARGYSQSPINIVSSSATKLTTANSLCWYNYFDEPSWMNLANDGNAVVLSGNWIGTAKPKIKGGPLSSSFYDFHSATFRWGPANDEGSEHTLDYVKYSMELQAMHVRRGIDDLADAAVCKVKDSVAVVSYFFQVTEVDNPYLDHVITNLWRIVNPGSNAKIPGFPLEWLMPKFEGKYYAYSGSLTHPPCSEIVVWIIQPRSLAISAYQLERFRNISSTEGPIFSNCRPVQKLNDRDVIYFP